ncbi:hypothetical protein CC78DRAFT_463721 [Lojkania enalia]|uniref:BZIP domain-containing protein n=1 Tax=Lojkania enalia TaxID=147567 RepID=A0A9P4N696_9PLEO|nr:hypothetical protein CC78DRAFT_463721 [Didymosphaeria enalia]
MQYADLMRPDEDWRGLGDPSERRKIQNRIAQRAYRRNMRERANKIEELKEQLRTYEDLHLHIAQVEDSTSQQSSSPSILPPHKRGVGGWCPPQQATPPAAPNKTRYNVSFPNEPQFSCVQQQVCPLTSPDLSVTTYENFAFDMAESVNKSRQSTSLLHIAVAGNHIDTAKVLLQDERIMIDDKDSDGFTPLQRAVMNGRSEIVKLLLEHSADTGPVRGGNLPLGAVSGFGPNMSRS